MTNKELYEELLKVKHDLKKKHDSSPKSPAICSDDTLKRIAVAAPSRVEELSCIPGVGKAFAEKYGEFFMKPLETFHNENASNAKITDDVRKTLKNLENRLVNINKRNRLLYIGKIYDKYAYDLYGKKMQSLIEYLTGKPSDKGFKLGETDFENSSPRSNKFKKLLTLMREVNKDIRESGQNDLYVGWPYLMGKMSGEDFNIRAPLALFPVKLLREDENIYVKPDETRDILYNSNLILTQYKFSGIKKELPNTVIEEIGDNFINNLSEYYGAAGIKFAPELPRPSAFAAYREGEFPSFRNGEYRLTNNAVLGKFSMYSSALQKDFKAIIENDKINRLLSELLENSEDIDYYSDEHIKEPYSATRGFTERQIDYINSLNASQENAVFGIEGRDELVIQGPPGTGKSQTITSLIVDYVLKGHNVLMVSQKKAALDVIYSRLGDLSQYAIFVSDTKDKEFFYSQLYTLLYSAHKSDFNAAAYDKAVNVIDGNIRELNEINDKLYKKSDIGTETYRLYQENSNNVFLTDYLLQSVGYETVIGEKLLSVSYPSLKGMREKFSDALYLGRLKEYFDLLQSYPWLLKVRKDIGRLELAEPLKLCTRLIEQKKVCDSAFFLAKPLYKSDITRRIREIMDMCFEKRHSVKEFQISPSHLKDGLLSFDRFSIIRALFDVLDEDEKMYITAVYEIASKTGVSMEDANRNVYDYAVLRHIDDFESRNKAVLSYIQNYNLIVDSTENYIERKRRLTREKAKERLYAAYSDNIASSKRFGEMKRSVESKRKQSVPKFIDKFGFELFRGIKIWLMTPEVVSESLALENGLFDLVIFDEASQLYVEKGVPAIQRAKKVVIAGDHKQLRPSSLGFGRMETDDDFEEDEEGVAALEEESLLDLARFKYDEVMLNFHYRSRYEELIAFSNYAFYHGRLMISPNTEKPDKPPIEIVKVKNGLWTERCNKTEAKSVVMLLKNYLKNRKSDNTVGIITFNSGQKDAIMDAIDEECIKDRDFSARVSKEWIRKRDGEDIGLFVKNIENVQGDERDCIIFSLAYAKNEHGKVVRNFGWLNQRGGENRLNVAISRAKEKIYIVTSINSSELYVDDLQNDGPKIFKKYLAYAEAVSAGRRDTAQNILLSFEPLRSEAAATLDQNDFAENIKDALIRCGYDAEKNVGIGGYSIDVAVRVQGKYVLGIECDSKVYADSDSVRDRDIHRAEYLENRGWKLHRVWSTDWWHSPEKEIERIRNIIGSLA